MQPEEASTDGMTSTELMHIERHGLHTTTCALQKHLAVPMIVLFSLTHVVECDCRQKRLAKQALTVQQSALSAPGSLSDARYGSPDDSAWETVVKKGNKGSKAASKAAVAPSAAAAPGLQSQASGLSQTGRVASGLLSGLAAQQSGPGQEPAGNTSMRSTASEGLLPEGSQSGESVASVHARSQDNESVMGSSSTAEQKVAQQQGADHRAAAEAGAEAAGMQAAAQAPQLPVRASNWAGLLKSPQSQQQQQDWEEEEQPASLQAAAHVVSDGAFPQLGSAGSAGLDEGSTPSQLSVSEHGLSFERSQGLSQEQLQMPSRAPSDSDVQSVPNSPFASGRALASRGSSVSAQNSQNQIAQQLHANAAIWGTGLTSGALGGISGLHLPAQLPQQLPQQPQSQQQQQPIGLYQTAASAAAPPPNNPWDSQPPAQPPPQPLHSSVPPLQAPAKPAIAPIKSVLPHNAQPFVPQARLSAPSQGQQPAFSGHANQQHARQQHQHQAAPLQQGIPGAHAFLQGSTFGCPQQAPNMAPHPYPSSSNFNSMLRPQQMHGLGPTPGPLLDPGLNRPLDPNNPAALQRLQRQRQMQQQQQQTGVNVRQQPSQQQQLAEIWSQPSLGVHQNGGTASAPGPFAAHQQPPAAAKGKPVGNGPFAAHQGSGSAFPQHQAPFSQQYNGLQQQQQQGRGGRFGGRANGGHFGGPSMNGMANGHLSSTGTQSEDDELLSGVFTKVWEDNLQVLHFLLHQTSPSAL